MPRKKRLIKVRKKQMSVKAGKEMLTENKQGLRCILRFGCYETAELAVTETGTRRFIGR